MVEAVVVTGLVVWKFELPKTDVLVTFHVFNPIKFCSSVPMDQLRDEMQNALQEKMAGHEDDAFESLAFTKYQAQMFFAMSREFQRYGVAITSIEPHVRLNE